MLRTFFAGALALILLATLGPALYAQGPAKKMPARDPKTGRFLKKADDHGHAEGGKKMPARDAKGRFIKKGDDHGHVEGGKMGGKKMPARDPKTGRFLKKH